MQLRKIGFIKQDIRCQTEHGHECRHFGEAQTSQEEMMTKNKIDPFNNKLKIQLMISYRIKLKSFTLEPHFAIDPIVCLIVSWHPVSTTYR